MPRPSYLVDTDWVIDHLCGMELVTRKLLDLEPEGLAISVISLAELYEGAHEAIGPDRRRLRPLYRLYRHPERSDPLHQ